MSRKRDKGARKGPQGTPARSEPIRLKLSLTDSQGVVIGTYEVLPIEEEHDREAARGVDYFDALTLGDLPEDVQHDVRCWLKQNHPDRLGGVS